MTILHVVKCETCENRCDISLMTKDAEYRHLPPRWFTLFPGDGQDGQHFCSEYCLMRWYVVRGRCVPVPEEPEKTIPPIIELDSMMLMCKPLPDGRFQSLVSGEVYQLVTPDHEYKARRFVYYDDNANATDGIQFSNGSVCVEVRSWMNTGVTSVLHYADWDEFKKCCALDGGVRFLDKPEPRTSGVVEPDATAIVGLGGACFNMPNLTLNWREGGKE